MSLKPAVTTQVEIELEIAAPVAKVWKSLVESTADWWPSDFHMTSQPNTVQLEAWPGGRLFETGGEGEGLLWATVQAVVPEVSLHYTGQVCPPFGGPVTSMVYIRLEPSETGTTFRLTDSLIGQVDDTLLSSLESGWNLLYGGLKKWAERG